MPDTKISALTEVTSPIAADVLPIVSGGATKKVQLGNLAIYKQYVALLTQTGTAAPVATVLSNTLGGTVVWARTSTGLYTATLSGAFASGKTLMFTGTSDAQFNAASGSLFSVYQTQRTSNNVISLMSYNVDPVAPSFNVADTLLLATEFTITVYP